MKDDFKSVLESSKSADNQNSTIHKLNNNTLQPSEQQPEDYFVAEIEKDNTDNLSPIIVSQNQSAIYKDHKHKKLSLNKEGSKHSFSCTRTIHKKPFWKRRIFNFAVVLVLGVVTGALLAGWYGDLIKPKNVIWPTESEIRDNENDVLTALNEITNSSDADFASWMNTAKAQGITPKDLSASQNFMLAVYNGDHATSFDIISHGKVATIATQSVYSRKAFNGEKYTFESISKGLLTIATCSVMKKDASNVDLFLGENVREDGADWTGKKTTYTTEEFYDYAGCTPNVLVPYIISSKTILYEDTVEIKETTYNDIPVYQYSVQLKTEASELYYVREVKQKSGLESYPEFFDITYTIMIDENWNFVHTEVIENYKVVAFKAPANCQGTMSSDYIFNQPVKLPV